MDPYDGEVIKSRAERQKEKDAIRQKEERE